MPLNRLDDTGQLIQPPDIQRTTLSLDVLGRFVCSTWDEAINNGGAPFDVVIIGAGMFGGYCADKLARASGRRPLRVLLLEAGPFLLPTHLQNLPRMGLNVPGPRPPTQDDGRPRELVWGMPWRSNVDWVGQAYCLGGKSLYWGGWCPRLEEDDLASWPPEVADYLRRNYARIERQVGVSETTDFIQGPLFELLSSRFAKFPGMIADVTKVENAPLAVQGQSPASGLFAFDKYSSVTLLIDAVREAAGNSDAARRLFIVPNTHVTKLETADGHVSGIRACVNGADRYLGLGPGTRIVLAAGMVESTRLALRSFPTSNDARTERIGRNLTSHVRSNMYFRVKRSALDPQNTLPKRLQTAALLVRGSTPDGKFQVQVTASSDLAGNSDAMLYTMIPDIDQLDGLLEMQESDWIAFAFRGASELKGRQDLPVPNTESSWINLSPFESDEFGQPRAYVHFAPNAADERLAQAMESCMVALAKALANGAAADIDLHDPQRDPLGSTYHESGTLWMGTDPGTSITDPDGRFHHIANAYCADQALFVTVGSVNPTLTGLTLARKVSEAIAAEAELA
ncbi:GMC oxidoreductase [Methylobacterium sp. 285MFTsu5.1]|uniref:GMC oxidoreductase n=1 Tax=Methylobacterium sp. 285MFTsu5.1 TaxID=1172187 RepID=UPI000379A19E|nr:GMC oxidoreductase [Methylobacterium sp. 285MFTsu5.1]